MRECKLIGCVQPTYQQVEDHDNVERLSNLGKIERKTNQTRTTCLR